jgi:GT2 family glycosyltransferase
MNITATVLHYRHWPETRHTLDALLAQTRPPDRVIVIENGSGDDSAEQIRAAYPQVEVIAIEENRGPLPGNNRAIREALEGRADAMLMMCDDSKLAPDALERLAERMEQKPSLGAVGPLTTYQIPDGKRMIHHGGYIDPRTWHIHFTGEPGDVSDWTAKPPHTVDWVEPGVLLMRADAMRQTGFLDEPLYYKFSELDYTLRMRRKGWELECLPSAVAYQDYAAPTAYIDTRNQLRITHRHAPFRFVVREVVRVVYLVGRDILDPRRKADRDTWSTFRALIDFLTGRWGPPPEGRHRS